MNWLNEIEWEDLLDKDSALIHQECGPEVLIKLWTHLAGITLYVSEKGLFEAKRRYIRKRFNPDSREFNAKALAALLNVSERFVYDALATTDKADSRQGKLLLD